MDWTKITAELTRDLDQKHVKPPRQYGPKGHYIEAWHAQAEANRIFGHDGWHQEVVETRCVMERERKIGRDGKDGWGVTYTAKVRIIVDGVCREDFGAGHGYDVDLGLAHESAIKEAVSDAMKRTLKSFGWPFGLALYDKDKAHVGNGADRNADIADPAPTPAEPGIDAWARTLIAGSMTLAGHKIAEKQIVDRYAADGRRPPREIITAWNAKKRELIRNDPNAPAEDEAA